MNHKRPLLLIILTAYIFAPTVYSWVVDPNGAWFRAFIIWALVVIVTFIIQINSPSDTE